MGKIFSSNSSAAKASAAKRLPSAKKSPKKSSSKKTEVETPIVKKKTVFPQQSLRNMTFCAKSGRTSPEVLQFFAERMNELIKQQLLYGTANMIGQQRTTLSIEDHKVALERMGMKYIASDS